MLPEVACSPANASECIIGDEAHGRRIYIHEASLAALAGTGPRQARLVYGMLGRVLVLKILRHRVEDAIDFALIDPAGGRRLVETAEHSWSEAATDGLRRLSLRAHPGAPTVPLLGPGECVIATCYYSNYYTFATGKTAAERMFLDTNDIATIRRMQREKTGYEDLVLITGDCLVADEPGLRGAESTPPAADPADVGSIKREALRAVQESTDQLLERAFPGQGAAEAELAAGIRSAVMQAFTRSIFKTEPA